MHQFYVLECLLLLMNDCKSDALFVISMYILCPNVYRLWICCKPKLYPWSCWLLIHRSICSAITLSHNHSSLCCSSFSAGYFFTSCVIIQMQLKILYFHIDFFNHTLLVNSPISFSLISYWRIVPLPITPFL